MKTTKIGSKPRTFQDLILSLQRYWSERGCVILQPYDMEVGAGTFHTATFLRAIGPERTLSLCRFSAGCFPKRKRPGGPRRSMPGLISQVKRVAQVELSNGKLLVARFLSELRDAPTPRRLRKRQASQFRSN